MMIGLMVENSHGTIHLFGEEEADHLMRESHSAERYSIGYSLLHYRAKSIWASYDKDHSTGADQHFLLQKG